MRSCSSSTGRAACIPAGFRPTVEVDRPGISGRAEEAREKRLRPRSRAQGGSGLTSVATRAARSTRASCRNQHVTSHRSTSSLTSIGTGSEPGRANALVVCLMTRAKTRYQTGQGIDGAAAGLLVAYAVVIGLFILWFYPIAQPGYGANPGLAAYQPPPGTVIPDMPVRVHQLPPGGASRRNPKSPRGAADRRTRFHRRTSAYLDQRTGRGRSTRSEWRIRLDRACCRKPE